MKKMDSADFWEQLRFFPSIAKAALFMIAGVCPLLGLFFGLLTGRSGYQDSKKKAHLVLLISGVSFFIWSGILILILFFRGICMIL